MRQRLVERLHAGLSRKLTLVSAPAGFGKTTLVSAWAAACERPVAWLSLDENDSDPTRFLTYLIAALQTIDPQLGTETLTSLQAAPATPLEVLLTTLLNELTSQPQPLILVLDDYHVIDNSAIDAGLAFLLEHLPAHVHLAIATREDPQLPLPRLRARAALTELRIADLRFTAEEATLFLNQVMGLNLSVEAVAALEQRTEGWIAGLQLAALSLQGRTDSPQFIAAFTGSHRFVLDYLVEEVLSSQPDAIRHFLLETALLNRLSAALCDAVTRREDSREVLATLERENLFIVALDDTRHWYRYHHLFADALQTHLLSDAPERIATLHERASAWYATHDLHHEAIHHALAAEAFEGAADLIEFVWPVMDQSYQSEIWIKWVQALPEAMIETRPMLILGYAWALLNRGDVDAAEARLQALERWLATPDAAEQMALLDQPQFQTLPAAIASARAYRALTMGDSAAGIHYAQVAMSRVTDKSHASNRQATGLYGIALWIAGDLEAADEAIIDFTQQMIVFDELMDATGGGFVLTEIRLTRGKLRDALSTLEHLLQLLATQPDTIGTEDLLRSRAQLQIEWHDLEAAQRDLERAAQLGQRSTLTNWEQRLHLTQANLLVAQGRLEAALEALDKAERLRTPAPLPLVKPIAAQRARIWLQQGQIDKAQAWARQQHLAADAEITFLREYDLITLARLYMAEGHLDKANALLERLREAAAANGRNSSLIEILCLQALAHADQDAALIALKAALSLAEPEGYVRCFIYEGPALAQLLASAQQRGIMPDYVSRLLAAFNPDQPQAAPTLPDWIEPLTGRELDVLRLLATDLSGPEIADALMISLNTIRTHTKNIYSKLDVSNRRAALSRADELGLL